MKLYKRKSVNDQTPLGQADPYMIKANGKYYVYATGPQLYVSDNLTEGWEYKGCPLDMDGFHSVWAPCVIEINGKYYMYFSAVDNGKDDQHEQTLRVAVADCPEGPFKTIKKLLPPFSIDPHVVKNASGIYNFYCQNIHEGERVGTHIFCDKMTDPENMEGNPVCVIRPTMDEEIFMKDRFKPGEHWHTVEGAFYFNVGETHFLMYSGACYMNPTYFIGYAVAHGPVDSDLRKLDWKKYPDENTYAPLLCNTDWIEGMGHNSVLEEDGKHYIVYHGRDWGDAELSQDARSARFDELSVDGDVLKVNLTR